MGGPTIDAVAPPAVSIRGVGKRFGGAVALDDVSFDVAAGSVHAVCGENGAGKSTLMKILAGVLGDYEGEILLSGEAVRFDGVRAAEAAGVAIIHQELNLVEQLTVAANIFLGREIARGPWLDEAAMNAQAAVQLQRLQCDLAPTRKVGELRVGDQQLIEIAKALSLEASVLIMDEPTSALTESESERLFGVIDTLKSRGVTILYISHKMNEVFRLADAVTVLRDGRHVSTTAREATSPEKVTAAMVGRAIESVARGRHVRGESPVMETRNLSLTTATGRTNRLNGVSLGLYAGEVVGVAGLMGAGRTELMECLFGAAEGKLSGEVRLNGQAVSFAHPGEATAAGVALVAEDRKRLGLFPNLSVGENISLCTISRLGGWVGGAAERRLVDEATVRFGVKTAGAAAPIGSLSGGNQQKAVLARWLLLEPKVLLLDDPTRGVDVGAKAEIYSLIDSLAAGGAAILVASSELPELLAVCDRIVVLCEGRLVAEFPREQATEAAIMLAATGAG